MSPLYVAVMESVPAGSDEVVHIATPLELRAVVAEQSGISVAVPPLLALRKLTVPAGLPSGLTVAWRVTDWLTEVATAGDGDVIASVTPVVGSPASGSTFERTVRSLPVAADPLLPLAVARLAWFDPEPTTAVSDSGPAPTGREKAAFRVPSPFPKRTLTVES